MTAIRSARPSSSSYGSRLEFSIDRLQAIVERIVRSSLRGDNAAPDVTQDALVQILQNLDSVRDPSRLESWIARVTVFTVRRELRRRGRSIRSVSMHDPVALPELASPSEVDDRYLLMRLDAALAQLAPGDRRLLLERVSSPSPLQERAATLGCSLSTLRRRLNRARKRLCRIMENDAELLPLSRAAFSTRSSASSRACRGQSRRTHWPA